MQLIGFIIILAGIYLCLWTYKNKPRQRWLRYLLSVIIFLLALIVGSSAKPAPKKAAKTVTKTKLVKKGFQLRKQKCQTGCQSFQSKKSFNTTKKSP